jgi:hypothetical protein
MAHFGGPHLSDTRWPGKVARIFTGRRRMLDRRQSAPDNVIHGSVANNGKSGLTGEGAVRDGSEKDVPIEFDPFVRRRSLLARMICWRDYFVGFAFSWERPFELPASDLGRRLRKSEKKKRQLERRINQLLDQR